MRNTAIIVLVVIGILGILSVTWLIKPANVSTAEKTDEKYWRDRIEEIGADSAYEEFLAKYAGISIGEQHTQAHIFGNALYKAAGLPGITVCDRNFNFGCYHEFIGWAVQEHGLSVASSLNENCLEKYESVALGCQHGIGHGVLASLGYDYENLAQALEVCGELRAQPEVGGCFGGAFMEYNLRTILGDESAPRPLDATLGRHYPCSRVETQYKNACYYEQPQWWQSLHFKDWGKKETRLPMFKHLGELCSQAKDLSYQIRCYRGIGTNAPPIVNSDLEEMKLVCQNMPNHTGEINCRAAAAGVFQEINQLYGKEWRMCEDLSESDKTECIRIAQSPR